MNLNSLVAGLLTALVWPTIDVAAQNTAAKPTPATTTSPLSQTQITAMKQIQTESEKKAATVALRLAQTAKQIYANMLADAEDQPLRQQLTTQLNTATAELLAIKGQSIREMVNLLTFEQKQLLKQAMEQPDAPADLAELMGKLLGPTVSKP